MDRNEAQSLLRAGDSGIGQFNQARARAAESSRALLDLQGLDLSDQRSPAMVHGHPGRRRPARECGADLSTCDLRGADFRGADLRGFDFSGSILAGARFHGALVADCNFARADLRGVRGLEFDGNNIRDVRFPPGVDEHWTRLHRAYTGLRYFVHLMMLVAFLAGYATRAVMWVGINEAQTGLVQAEGGLQKVAQPADGAATTPTRALEGISNEIEHAGQSLQPHLKEFRVWQVLIGLDRGWDFAVLAVLLVLYNSGRAWLTYAVSSLRDEEVRSGHAPHWRDYGYLWLLSQRVMPWLMYISFASFAWHAWEWITMPVWVPA